MADLAQLSSWRDRLLEATFNGLRTVRDSNGEEVTYRSQSELRMAVAAIDSEIARMISGRSSRILPQTSKGV